MNFKDLPSPLEEKRNMDLDNLQQNMNTRVVFREPRGMIRWCQMFFAIIAFSTVADFQTTILINITCPPPPPAPPTAAPVAPVNPNPPAAANASVAPAAPTQAPAAPPVSVPPPLQQGQQTLVISYPFDFSQQKLENSCPGQNATYSHTFSSLTGSPQFFVMTGVLSLIYAALSLVVYLLFSSTYDSVPVWPVADLIIAAILCLFWFIASSSFSSGVSLLKTTTVFDPTIKQTLCPTGFLAAGGQCTEVQMPSWRALNVALVSGFTSFFLWGSGLWFVYKETHFHTPRDTFGPR